MHGFYFAGQLVELFATYVEAQSIRDEQEAFWLSMPAAFREDELMWDDVSDAAIRAACTIHHA